MSANLEGKQIFLTCWESLVPTTSFKLQYLSTLYFMLLLHIPIRIPCCDLLHLRLSFQSILPVMVPADAFDESCDKVSYSKYDLLTSGTCLLTMRERHDLGIVKKAAGHWPFHTPQLSGQ